MRIVIDTATFVTAVRSADGAAGEVLRMVFRKEVIPLMDLKLGLEYRAVALRPEHVQASKLSAAQLVELIEAIEAYAEAVNVGERVRPLSNDSNDDMILDIAVHGGADVVITNNRKHFIDAGRRFGIGVHSPAEFLGKFKGGQDVR